MRKVEDLQEPILEIWDKSSYSNVKNKSIMNIELKKAKVFDEFNPTINDMFLHALRKYQNLDIILCMNMDILQTNEYYGEHLKIHFNKFGIKNESVNKKTLLNILYQIHYDQLEIQTKNQIETFFESRYPFFKKMKDEDMIHLTILILLKKNLKTSHITSQFESSFCIFVPYSKTNKWVLSTIFLNDNTMKFLKNQEFKFYLKRDSDYEQTRNWIKIYRHFYFDELSSIDQSQVLLFSSIMLYFIGHRNAKDLDVMAHNLSEEGLLKIQDLHERYAKKDSIEEQKKTPFYLKNKSEFMDLSIKNTEFWPNYWDEWLNRWARESNAKYFEEVLGNGEYHSYFLGMKTVTMEMDIVRRIIRNRSNSVADLITFKMRYSFVPIQLPEVPTHLVEYKKLSSLDEERKQYYLENGGVIHEERDEMEIHKKIDIDLFVSNIQKAIHERYKTVEISDEEIRKELNIHHRPIKQNITMKINRKEESSITIGNIMRNFDVPVEEKVSEPEPVAVVIPEGKKVKKLPIKK